MQSHPSIFRTTICISIGLISFSFNPQYTFRSVPHIRGFIIAGTDRIFYPATVTVKKKEIIVQSPDVPHPVAVRYNWANHTDGTLFGASGLPVAPFRTDNW